MLSSGGGYYKADHQAPMDESSYLIPSKNEEVICHLVNLMNYLNCLEKKKTATFDTMCK